jgi:hypothetical protein
VYRVLARLYGWTFDTIANMTPEQQLQALMAPEDVEGTTKFRDENELLAYMQRRELEVMHNGKTKQS